MWETYIRNTSECDYCRNLNILDNRAFPLFMRTGLASTDVFFIWEAPNRDDTYNSRKGYITVDSQTDPSGAFFHDLFVNELRLDVEKDLFVTNSVLCLPAPRNGKYPVSRTQMENCSKRLRELIDTFRPLIVSPLGTKALKATTLLEDHGLRNMADAVGRQRSWYGRILYPLYHTSSQARNPRNGRVEGLQRADWRKLRELLDKSKAQQRDAADRL
jgi:uracil-DNA glycosylase family 4